MGGLSPAKRRGMLGWRGPGFPVHGSDNEEAVRITKVGA